MPNFCENNNTVRAVGSNLCIGRIAKALQVPPDFGCIYFEKKETPCCENCKHKREGTAFRYCYNVLRPVRVRNKNNSELINRHVVVELYWVCDYHEPVTKADKTGH